jgi:ribosome maturation factor RimP
MRFDRNHLLEMLQESLSGPELFIVGLTVSDSAVRPKITAILDSEQGMGIEEYARVSRR